MDIEGDVHLCSSQYVTEARQGKGETATEEEKCTWHSHLRSGGFL